MMANIQTPSQSLVPKPFANLLYHSPTNSIMQPPNFLTSLAFVHKLQNFHTSYNPLCATSINSKALLAQVYNAYTNKLYEIETMQAILRDPYRKFQ